MPAFSRFLILDRIYGWMDIIFYFSHRGKFKSNRVHDKTKIYLTVTISFLGLLNIVAEKFISFLKDMNILWSVFIA